MGITRLRNHDYGSDNWYFVTICTDQREHFFGEIIGGKGIGAQNFAPPTDFVHPADLVPPVNFVHPHLRPTPIGQIAQQYWTEIPKHFPFVVVDEFVIMPDHMHGLLYFDRPDYAHRIPRPNEFGSQSKNLASVIRGYKAGVKKYATMNNIPFAWQSLYHDHVVRTERRLQIIRRYIQNNPGKWFEKNLSLKLTI